MVSVVIPSYKDPYLEKTINSLLENAEGEIEVIAVLDGYWPEKDTIVDDPRVRYVHLGKNRGMRRAINAGVSVARGKYIMRTDEHCMFAPGYDVTLSKNCDPKWIVTPVRYFLDVEKWEKMDKEPVVYEKLMIQDMGNGVRKFAGFPWSERTEERKDRDIDGTMAMQGSCWLMHKKWWEDVIGELQHEGYGPLYQDSHEMVFKTWKAGGRLMVNKKTWFAHKHRKFPRTHSNGTDENPSKNEQCWAYALEQWEDYYENEIKPAWGI